jgi:Trk-type K+ transport system membrane component
MMKKIIRRELSYAHEHITGVKPPAGFLPALSIMLLLLTAGTLFYSHSEKWSYLDSLYFSVTTLATVGFGDLHPTNDASKIFTMFYIFLGMGLVLYIVSTFSKSIIEGREIQNKRMEEMSRLAHANKKNNF